MASSAQLSPILPHTSKVPLVRNEETTSNLPCEERPAPGPPLFPVFPPTTPATRCWNCHPLLPLPLPPSSQLIFNKYITTKGDFYSFHTTNKKLNGNEGFSTLSEAFCPSQETQTSTRCSTWSHLGSPVEPAAHVSRHWRTVYPQEAIHSM